MNNQEYTLTAERPEHVDGVREVETRSFPTEGEAFLVDRLRANGNLTISLVALASASGQVVGHVALSPVVSADGEEGIAIGPIAVTPSHQNRGVGSALMERSISEATDQGYRWVVLLGDPNWYSRFGFGPASRHGLVDQWMRFRSESWWREERRAVVDWSATPRSLTNWKIELRR